MYVNKQIVFARLFFIILLANNIAWLRLLNWMQTTPTKLDANKIFTGINAKWLDLHCQIISNLDFDWQCVKIVT